MVFLVGGVILAAVLYGWLVGNWFGRVVAFPLLAIIVGFVGAWVIGNIGHSEKASIWGFFIGVALAWPISGIPGYVRRRQAGQSMEMTLR